jgi:hypothetical protein
LLSHPIQHSLSVALATAEEEVSMVAAEAVVSTAAEEAASMAVAEAVATTAGVAGTTAAVTTAVASMVAADITAAPVLLAEGVTTRAAVFAVDQRRNITVVAAVPMAGSVHRAA